LHQLVCRSKDTLDGFVCICVSMYLVCARNTTVICCCQRWRTTLTLHQLHFADANRHQKMTTRTYTYFLRQSKACMFSYASLLFSPSCFCALFPRLSRLVSQVLTINETKCKFFFFSLSLSSIHTYIHSIICTVSRIQTDIHLKHCSLTNR
jgi:hypothetical protein